MEFLLLVLLLLLIFLVGSFIMHVTAWLATIIIGAIIFLTAKYINDRRERQNKFKRLGIPGPKPSFWLGNVSEIQKDGLKSTFAKWHQQYGKTFGYYEGDKAILVTSDVDLIKQVYIKDFSSFHSRKASPFQALKKSVFGAGGSDWKRLRMITSPTFSAGRMKQMSPVISGLVESLMTVFDKEAVSGESFNIMQLFQGLTMSVIGSCGFGLDLDAVNEPENVFLKKCRGLFDSIGKNSFNRKLILALYIGAQPLYSIFSLLRRNFLDNQMLWFHDTSAAIIESRKTSEVKRNDFIQLMLNAEQNEVKDVCDLEVNVDEDTRTREQSTETSTKVTTNNKGNGKGMTQEEMQAQCILFLLAGYETTSTSLSFAAYELALNPDVQQKLQAEVDQYLPGDAPPDYLSVQRLPYMDMFFSEVLRVHTLGLGVTNRDCNKACVVGGVPLEEGDAVQVTGFNVHLDPELWGPEDPKDFIPERFLPERKAQRPPMAWLPFGGGPRNCVGMRFALMEAKICLAMMLKRFTLIRTDKTQVPLKVAEIGVPRPLNGVWIRLEKRT